jgi:hypothetical protein
MSPAFKPTAEQRESVELMISYGAPETEICLLIKNPETGNPVKLLVIVVDPKPGGCHCRVSGFGRWGWGPAHE